jgi:hypothetical protein
MNPMLNTGRTVWQSRGMNGQDIAPGAAWWQMQRGYDTFMVMASPGSYQRHAEQWPRHDPGSAFPKACPA